MLPRVTSRLAILLSLALFLAGTANANSPRSSAAAADNQIYWGALVKGGIYGLPDPPYDMRAVDRFEQNVGKKISIFHFGNGWYLNGIANRFPTNLFNNVRAHGAIPYFSWSSRDGNSVDQPNFRNAVIASGAYDSYIRQWATDAKNWSHPFFLGSIGK